MAKSTFDLTGVERKIDEAIKATLLDYGRKIFADAMSGLPAGAAGVRSSFNLTQKDNGYTVEIYSDNVIAAYIEFGTGPYASAYLVGKPQEMVDEAIQFFISGQGTMPARPYLFPALYKNQEQLVIDLDKAVQKVLDAA